MDEYERKLPPRFGQFSGDIEYGIRTGVNFESEAFESGESVTLLDLITTKADHRTCVRIVSFAGEEHHTTSSNNRKIIHLKRETSIKGCL